MRLNGNSIKRAALSLLAVSVVAIGSSALPSAFAADAVVAAAATGKAAPTFSLKDTKGKTHQLSDLTGKTVVLEWFNDGCPFVKKHYNSGNMQKLQKAYTQKGVIWFTVSSSAPGKQGNHTPEEFDTLLKGNGWGGTALLLDSDGAVGKAYGAKTTPHMFIIDPKGILVYAGAIDDAPDPDEASIPKAKNFVKVALDETLAGKPVSEPATKAYGCSVKYQ